MDLHKNASVNCIVLISNKLIQNLVVIAQLYNQYNDQKL